MIIEKTWKTYLYDTSSFCSGCSFYMYSIYNVQMCILSLFQVLLSSRVFILRSNFRQKKYIFFYINNPIFGFSLALFSTESCLSGCLDFGQFQPGCLFFGLFVKKKKCKFSNSKKLDIMPCMPCLSGRVRDTRYTFPCLISGRA